MRRFGAAVLAFLILTLAVGCSGKSGDISIDVDKTVSRIMNAVEFSDQMSEIAQDTVIKLYGLESERVVKAAAYESTGATAEEVAVFQAKSAEDADEILEAAKKRIEDQKAGFQDYQPGEMEKLKNPLLVQKGNYVILCVADDTAPAQKIIDDSTAE